MLSGLSQRNNPEVFTQVILAIAFSGLSLIGHLASLWPLLASVTVFSLLQATLNFSRCIQKESAASAKLLDIVFIFQASASSIVAYLGFFGCLQKESLLIATIIFWMSSLIFIKKRECSHLSKTANQPSKKYAFEKIAVWVLLIWITFVFFKASRYRPQDSDNMWYHLPMIAEWKRTGSIWPSATSPIPEIAIGYPGHAESLGLFFSAFTYAANLYIFASILFLILFVLGCVNLFKKFGSFSIAIASTIYCLSMPIVSTQVYGNDIAIAANLICFVSYCISTFRDRSSSNFFLAGLAGGLSMATKYSGALIAPVLILIVSAFHLLDYFYSRDKRAFRFASLSGIIPVFAIGLLVPILPWYIRNSVFFGNPLYPAKISIGGLTIFDGPLTNDSLSMTKLGWNIFPLIEKKHFFIDAFGIFAIIMLASFPLLFFIKLKQRGGERLLFLFSWFATWCCFVSFLHQPFNRPSFAADYNMRYIIHWGVFSISVIASFFSSNSMFSRFFPVVAVIAAMCNFYFTTHYFPLIFCVAVVGALFQDRIVLAFSTARPIFRQSFACFSMFFLTGAVSVYVDDRFRSMGYVDYKSQAGWAGISNYVHKNIKGGSIVCAGDNRFFPLYGENLDNRVFFKSSFIQSRSVDDLMRFIRETKSTHLVVFPKIVGRDVDGTFQFDSSYGSELSSSLSSELKIIYSTHENALLFEVLGN